MLRRAKRKNNADPIVRDILTWTRFGPAMLCTMITYVYAIVDDGVRAGMAYVQQRYFIVQFLFTAFDYGAQIFLLVTVYTLLFRLMHRAPLGSGWLSRVHVANYMTVRIVFCVVLGLLAIVVEGVSLAFLTQSVFITTGDLADGVGNAAFNINLVYGFLYLVAALEVLVVSGHMVRMQKKFRAGNKRVCIFATRSIRPRLLAWLI